MRNLSVVEQKRAAIVVLDLGGPGSSPVAGDAAGRSGIRCPGSHPDGRGAAGAAWWWTKGTSLGEICAPARGRTGHHREHPSWFRFYANERGLAQKIRAGDYALTSTMSPKELLERLVEGVPVEEATVTIPEGKNMEQVAELLDAAGVVRGARRASRLARDAGLARTHGRARRLAFEGYLYPDTYRFRAGYDAACKVVSAAGQARPQRCSPS